MPPPQVPPPREPASPSRFIYLFIYLLSDTDWLTSGDDKKEKRKKKKEK